MVCELCGTGWTFIECNINRSNLPQCLLVVGGVYESSFLLVSLVTE